MKQYRDSPYFVTEDGQIFSKVKNKFMKFGKAKGYYRINLMKPWGTKLVHRMVAELYIENPENKKEVNHIDGNILNNNISNLEWVTRSENEYHKHRLKKQTNTVSPPYTD